MNTKAQQTEQQAARDTLRDMLPVGSTVTTILRHVSRSGMSRSISTVISHNGEVRDITALVARATGDKLDHNHGGVKVGGCGMDMGFALVYELSRALYPNGHKCTGHDGSKRGTRCPSNDHSNDYGDLARQWRAEHPDGHAQDPDERDGTRQDWMREQLRRSFRKSRTHSDGGYALNQRWS